MITDTRELVSAFGSSVTHEADSPVARVARQLKRVACSVRGHEEFLQFERNRLFLRCLSCGYESQGWVIGKNGPSQRKIA